MIDTTIFDIPEFIKKASTFFVHSSGYLSLTFKDNDTPLIIRHNDDSTSKGQDYKVSYKNRDTIYIFDAKDKYAVYGILQYGWNEYWERRNERFFIFLIDDFNKIKDKDIESMLQIKQEMLKDTDIDFEESYNIMESSKVFKIIDHWYDLTNHDYTYPRFISI